MEKHIARIISVEKELATKHKVAVRKAKTIEQSTPAKCASLREDILAKARDDAQTYRESVLTKAKKDARVIASKAQKERDTWYSDHS